MKRIVSMLLVMVMSVSMLFTGCTSPKVKTTKYVIYDLNDKMNGVGRENIKMEDGTAIDQIEFLISEMKKKSKDGSLMRPISRKIHFQDYRFNDATGDLTLSFDRTYENLQGVEETLTRACIVLTLLQVEEVLSVNFEIEHEPLTVGSDMSIVGPMNADSFVLSLAGDESVSQTAKLNLFYPAKDGSGLIYEKREVSYASNMSLERVVMKYLAEQPKPKNAIAALSSNTSILNIYVADGVCYLNLGTSFVDNVSDDMLKLKVYAIVNSLCSLQRVKRVQISVGGKNLRLSGNSENKDALYLSDESLILNAGDMDEK